MTDRSIVVKLKADISALLTDIRTAKSEIASVAQTSEQASKRTSAATLAAGEADKIRASTRKAALAQEIRGQEQAAAAAQKYGRATAFVSGHSQEISTLGNGFLKLGVAAAAGVGVSVAAFANFDEQMSHVIATGDDARASQDALRKAAIQAGADTKYSATEAAAGEEALLKAGVSAQDVLGGGLSGALNLAASGNLDVADSAEVAASAMTQFGLKGSQVPHIADLLAAGAGKAQGEVSDLGAALNQSGLVASGFGLSIEETVGSLAAFASAGLTGSDAGTSFKTMIQRLENPTDSAAATLKRYNIQAYDAQGKFVGMANFAEQLQTRLAGLTDEQRNAALATIFGADAIRGANVLYKEGGAGITDWTNKVNDAGFASKQAAARMDNLKGDVEQLKGSLDTDLIQSGSGANDLLRELTQGATSAANSFGKLPNGIQQGALGLLALVAAGALSIAGLAKVAVGAAETRTALAALNITGATTSATLGRIGAVAGPVAAALLAAEAAGHLLDTYGSKVGSQDAVTAQLTQLAAAQDQVSASSVRFESAFPKPDKLNLLYQAVGLDTSSVTSLDGALRASTAGGVYGFARGIEEMVESIRPGKQSLERMRDGLTQVDTGLASLVQSGHADQAASAFQKILADDPKLDASKVAAKLTAYRGALESTAQTLGVTTLSAQDYAGWMGGKVPAAVTAAAKANPQLASSLSGVGAAADTNTAKLQSYAEALLAVSSATGDVEDAIDAANKLTSAKGFKPTHDQGTAKGRANQGALDSVGSKSQTALSDLATAGGSQQALDAAAAHYKKKYREIAEDIGYSGKAAKAFADDIIKTPKAVSVRVVTPGAKVSADQAAVLNHELQGIPENKRAKIVTLAETKGAKAAYDAIQRVKDKQVIAKADGAPAGAKNVDKIMRSLKDRLVKATARGDSSGAKDVRDAIARLKGKNVDVKVDADTSGAVEARNAIATVHGKTVNVVINRVAKGDADGGYIGGLLPGYDGGGKVRGRGGPREDNVAGIDQATGVQTSWVSVGEMVTNAKSTANNFGVLSTINANPDKQYGLVELADGGLPRYAKGSTNGDVANVVQLQRNVDEARNLAELARALKAQEKATKSLTSAEQTSSEAIKSLTGSLRDEYASKSNDAGDLLASQQQGAADLNLLTADLKQLSGLGLSKGLIDQITARGAATGGLDLAQSIIDGGKSLVDSLNKANAGLDAAATNVGLAANGVPPKKKAGGGPIWGPGTGTSDDVPLWGSNGEFMVKESVAAQNMAFLHAFNAGHKVLPSYAATSVSAGAAQHVDRSYHAGDTVVQHMGDLDSALRKARTEQRTALTMARLTTPLF